MKPFEVKSPDGRSQWKKIYDLVQGSSLAHVFTFSEIYKETGIEIRKGHYYEIRRANAHLLKNRNRMLVSVKGVGYKVGTPEEHLLQASTRPRRARNQIKIGILEAENVDKKRMTLEQKKQQMDLKMFMQVSMASLSRKQHKAIELQERAVEVQKTAQKAQRSVQAAIEDIEKKIQEIKEAVDEGAAREDSKADGKTKSLQRKEVPVYS